MKHVVIFVIALLLVGPFCVVAQPQLTVQHYGIEDGLPQNTVVDITQDRKGFMWFATPDMLCRFDGLTFHSYSLDEGDNHPVRNNRFDRIQFDAQGYLWITTRDYMVYRFDPITEKFTNLSSTPAFKDNGFRTRSIYLSSSGKTWVVGRNMGCYCFNDTFLKPIIFNTTVHRIGNNNVMSVFEDASKNSWVLTTNGLYRYSSNLQPNGTYFKDESFFCAAETPTCIWFGSQHGLVYCYEKSSRKFRSIHTKTTSPLTVMTHIDDQRLFIASANNDFIVYNLTNGSQQRFSISTLGHTLVTTIRSCYVDHKKNIWIETGQPGISKFNPETGSFKHFELKTENFADHPFSPRTMVWEDVNDRLWIQQYGGGFGYYDAATDQLRLIANIMPPNTDHFSAILYAGFSDKQGNLWLSSKSQGIEKIIFPDRIFRTLPVDSSGNNNVRSIMEDSLHRIWVGTKGEKITIFNSELKKLGCITANGSIGQGPPLGGMPYSMIADWQGNVWVGTKGKGVYKLVPNKAASSYTVHHYVYNKAAPYSLSDDKVYRIYQDSHHRIWIGTYSAGLNLFDNRADGRFYSYRNKFKNYPIKLARHVRSIAEDAYGMLYLGTTKGLMAFPAGLAENGPEKYRFYQPSPESGGISGTDIYDVCATTSKEIYLAISGTGFNRVVQRDAAGYPVLFDGYSTRNGLNSNLTSQIREDLDHHLWIVSESSLMRFTPAEGAFENYPDIAGAIKGASFSEGGDIVTSTGHVLLGTTGGLIEIYPERIKRDTFKPYMAFTGFQLANHKVTISPSSPLAKNIDELQTLKLNYKQNFITIEFAALDFANTKHLKYAYRLDGVDSTWVSTAERNARYINLAPGNYIFHVRSTNGRGLWLTNERKFEIVIVPAIWQTWWAKLLYVLAGFGLVILISRWTTNFYRLKDKLQLEKDQTEMKTTFFTDISHEIRTPLTLIVSPVEHILEKEPLTDSVASQLKLVLKNSKRMLQLVNQILDFRKIQDQLLMVSETAIGEQVSTIATDFFSIIGHKGIQLKIDDRTAGKRIWIDADSLEKLSLNLLSNAVKHTQPGATIEVNLFMAGEKLALQVKDHGYGMSNEVMQKLFSRFVSYNPDKTNPSTGIGLSIVKEIADRHGAEIKVESKQNEGSTFTIFFLTGVAHFAGLPNITFVASPTQTADALIEISEKEPIGQNDTNSETILLIEDDDELRHYIGSLLRGSYKVLEAPDGAIGLTLAQQEIPDFIISDIMMPRMTGFEFLEALRRKPLTSHIPLIFLTAKADPDTELAAYERGADAFITKPFSIKILKSRIRSIIDQRKRLYIDFGQNPIVADVSLTVSKSSQIVNTNERFLTKIRQEVENNISNAAFSVDDLIATMPMSRSVFVKKLRSLTGQSPIEYIRMVKIKHAAALIDTDQYSIKEVSHMIGIHDTKYFSQRFKELMGMLPKEYKKHHK